MALGPGKYDGWCSRVRIATQAIGVVIIVFGGEDGSGFAVQGPESLNKTLPDVLEFIAAEIRKDIQGKGAET